MTNNTRIPLFKIRSNRQDRRAVGRVLKRKLSWAAGPEIRRFEDELSKQLSCSHVSAFSSGTTALFSLISAFDFRDYEVIIPSFTYIATLDSVIAAGGIPVLADIEPDTCGLDASSVERCISDRTRMIILVHYAGMPARDTEKLRKLSTARNIVLIEDAAGTFGAVLGERKVGTFGDAAIFSFSQGKIITTGEGGIVATNSTRIHEAVRSLRSHGRSLHGDAGYGRLGYNYKMTSFSAALGLSQLQKLESNINLRRRIAGEYCAQLGHIKSLSCITEPDNTRAIFQMFPVFLENTLTRDRLRSFLLGEGIGCNVYFEPVHRTARYFKPARTQEGLDVTLERSAKVLTLPIYPELKLRQVRFICGTIKQFLTNHTGK